MTTQFDVIIVGAGTAGLYAAIQLAKAGFSVCIVEQKPLDKLYKITGDAIGKHHVEQHKIELYDKLVENVYTGAYLISPEENIRFHLPGEGYSLNMYEWSRMLVSKALQHGVTILDKHTAVKPIVSGSDVRGLVVKRSDENVHVELTAKLVIDASGATAVIRTRLPKEWPVSEEVKPEDVSYAYREIVELDREIEDVDKIRIYMNQEVAPGGYWWFFPKGRNVANVGLGIWGKLVRERGYNPVNFYRKYILRRPEMRNRKVVNAGGGIVPTRRSVWTLVWNNFVAIGDAACTVNPVHGGGLGPALLSASIAAQVVIEAYEYRGNFGVDSLWPINLRYLQAYGIKQAKLDILRLALQHMDNNELQRGLEAKILEEAEILAVSAEGREPSLLDKLKMLWRLRRVPLSLIKKLLLARTYMKRMEELYREYPDSLDKLQQWIERVRALYNEYLSKLAKCTE